jgi:hypothetical protein
MKRLFTFLTVAIIVVGIGMSNLSSGPLKPPLGYTGAPGESDCTTCHSGTPINGGGGNITLAFSGANNTYKLDKTYTVTVTVTDAGMSPLCCFETTTLTAANHPAGKLKLITPENTMIRNSSTNGRSYITNYETANFYQQWSYKWKAPSADVGPIIMYATGNASNNNGNPLGDHIYGTALTINPAGQFMKTGEESNELFSVYPTLIHQQVNIDYSLNEAGTVTIHLYNMNGQLQEILFDGSQETGSYKQIITLKKQYSPGVYLLVTHMGDETETTKLMIQ